MPFNIHNLLNNIFQWNFPFSQKLDFLHKMSIRMSMGLFKKSSILKDMINDLQFVKFINLFRLLMESF